MTHYHFLVLPDGSVHRGPSFGYPAPRAEDLMPGTVLTKAAGEVVFNTGMSGYHEILTDPSYAGQIVVMTYPHIGNYGTSADWSECGPEAAGLLPVKAAGFAVRALYSGPVPEGRISLDRFLSEQRTPGISGIDTRSLALRIRDEGSPLGVIVRSRDEGAVDLTQEELGHCREYLERFPPMEGRNLIDEVGTRQLEVVNPGGFPHILLVDCGVKANIIRELTALGCRVSVLPSVTDTATVMDLRPDAVLFSNGPGDPGVLDRQVGVIRDLIGHRPVFGICLGHQLIARALGASTYKMKFGHHGINHPVRDETTGRVMVTSQNHGFAVDESTLPADAEVWFRNANDRSNEGIRHRTLPLLSVQFHPEAAPGPQDAHWIFRSFLEAVPGYAASGAVPQK